MERVQDIRVSLPELPLACRQVCSSLLCPESYQEVLEAAGGRALFLHCVMFNRFTPHGKLFGPYEAICSLFSEVQPSTSEPEGFLPIPGQCCWYKHGLLLGGKGWQLYSVTNGNPWRMETHCTQKSQNFCISTAEPVVIRGIYQGFGLLWGVLLLILPIPQHKIPDYIFKKSQWYSTILHVSSCIYTWGSKGPCKDF